MRVIILVIEPTIYTNSFFGDGDASIIFSEVACRGYEQSIVNCPRKEYGSFTCSRDNVVGITCQDSKYTDKKSK